MPHLLRDARSSTTHTPSPEIRSANTSGTLIPDSVEATPEKRGNVTTTTMKKGLKFWMIIFSLCLSLFLSAIELVCLIYFFAWLSLTALGCGIDSTSLYSP
jgi:hypothetical protein